MNLQVLGGRRFILTLITGISNIALTWFSKIDSSTYSLVTLGIVGAFITGNVVESVKTNPKE